MHRFRFREIELARVGPFLLLAGSPEALGPYRDRAASILVEDVDEVAQEIAKAGGEILERSSPGPNGERLIAQHPDGTVFVYLEGAS